MSLSSGSPFDWGHQDNYLNVGNKSVKSIDCKNLEITDGNASYLFSNLKNLEEIINLDTSSVTNMEYMFYMCGNIDQPLDSLGLPPLDTSSATNMESMFAYFYFKNLDLSGFDTRLVTNMKKMFAYSQRTENLDLSSFNIEAVTNADGMFSSMYKCTKIIAKDWTTNENIKNTADMFNYSDQLPGYSKDKISGEYAKPITDGGYFTPPEEA